MEQKTIFLIILGMALVTYIPRVMPLWLLSAKSLPPVVTIWLRYVPVAVLAAMLLPSLVVRDQRIDLGFDNLFLWAAIPTILTAWKTRSFFGTVVVGMGTVAAARYLLSM
ncbi:AzlD domain-containing protein [Effusibacillus lacus]|uniref:Branched-chain amino acid transport n=1 Tax=Effusibacillus lacus TaxID=1348429 RepID=A0A292YIA4_9BACL|nr:AzlD domain-containing protein [Effusibacillus lacus]TCS68585.1 branched-subunit amino acid transport protein [Effusibacillus lacus]GAX88826.1 branched-chain amino acid transport [Effusibacillus lacus]